MTAHKYILDANGVPQIEPDLLKWAKWFQEAGDRVVKQEKIGKYFLSTVFLSLDHNFSVNGPPILWETMLFEKRGRWNKSLQRYVRKSLDAMRCSGSREQAEAMHEAMKRKHNLSAGSLKAD